MYRNRRCRGTAPGTFSLLLEGSLELPPHMSCGPGLLVDLVKLGSNLGLERRREVFLEDQGTSLAGCGRVFVSPDDLRRVLFLEVDFFSNFDLWALPVETRTLARYPPEN